MSIYELPSTSFEASTSPIITGLVGTIGVRIVDGQGATTLTRTTAGIIEYPASSGIYTATLTSPSLAGTYLIVWDANGEYADEELVITSSVDVAVIPSSSFTDRDRVRLKIGDTDMTDALLTDEEIDVFITDNTVDSEVDLYGAAADSARAIAAKFSRGFNFSTDGQSFNRSERVNHYTALSRELRAKSSGVGSSVPVKSSVAAATDDNLTLGNWPS